MSSRAKKILLLLAAAALLTVNGFLLPVLNRERATLGITRVEPLENAPPMLALTTQVLGGFRGLIANALWIRLSKLQEDGKYFEMVQLADWITKLEPHIVQVWIVQSWNMSFNISVKFSDYSDRWRWVQRGMELLRDEAIRYNPGQPLLYAELSWLFQFKMGQNLDDAHVYYKGAWAMEMMQIFGGEQPNFEKLINPQTPDERERARLLREKYKMDAAKMRALHERYGPLDWRLPEAHAIYWSSVGMDHAKGEDVRRLRSGIYQSMHLAYQRGRLVLSSNSPPRLLPNLDIAPKVDAAYQEQIADAAVSAAFLTNNMAKAYRNFLRDVPYQFFIYNRVREGEQWLRYLREKFPDAVPAGTTLAEYAVNRASENVTGQSQVRIQGLIEAMLTRAYYALIEDNADDFNQYMLRAAELWNAYTRQIKANQRIELSPLDELKDIVLRRMLSPEGGLAPEEIARLRTMEPRAAQLSPVNPPQQPK
jgi:hypothetical protein